MLFADGQSIATRLAKKISSATSTLKRSVNRYNSMHRDTLEGSAYSLPSQLNWVVVSNLEELSSLEVTSLAGNSKIAIQVWIKVVRASNLKKRSIEEEQMVKSEMKVVEDTLKAEHSLLVQNIHDLQEPSQYQVGCLNLLNKQLLLSEVSLMNFSETVKKYHSVLLPQFHVIGPDGLFDISTINEDTSTNDFCSTTSEESDCDSSDCSDIDD